ncbi:MAG TPA: hypothetical protein VE959_35110 [Bryobacteraceae bacterium]|nr:hypothetical protein [Bryobacteraceae bacterium]
MAESPVPLSLEEHRELARELREAEACLRELCDLVAGVYGPDSRATFMFRRTVESLSRLRREMQVQAALDLPGGPADEIYV